MLVSKNVDEVMFHISFAYVFSGLKNTVQLSLMT